MSHYAIDEQKAAWREVDNELILINLENTYYYSLNATGAFIWSLLQVKPSTIQELTVAVAEKYGIANDVASNDVTQLISMLHEENLIKAVDEE